MKAELAREPAGALLERPEMIAATRQAWRDDQARLAERIVAHFRLVVCRVSGVISRSFKRWLSRAT